MSSPHLFLNAVFLKNRVAELGLKQWWLAEQIGVDKKTVTRWLQGQVRSLQSENMQKLAQVLQCSEADLTLRNEADQLATADDQKTAARLLISSSLLEKLGPIGEWNVIESLVKANLVPDLPLNILGELYNQLTVALWRQSKIDQAALYNEKALEIARRCGDKSVQAAAFLSKANISSWRGKTLQAISTYEQGLALAAFIEEKTLGGTYSNLSAVLYECGEFEKALTYQKKALEIFNTCGRPMNLSIVHCHFALIYLQTPDLNLAAHHCEKSVQYARQDDYKRGLAMARLIYAEIYARHGLVEKSLENLNQGLVEFKALGIEEGLNYEFAGRVWRILKDLSLSEKYLRHGIPLAEGYPMYQAALYFELALTLGEAGSVAESARIREMAAELYTTCEALKRAEMVMSPHVPYL